jgi:hypothetical protein
LHIAFHRSSTHAAVAGARGVLIPSDAARAAIVTIGQLYRRWTGLWNGAAADLDMAAARRIIVNTTTSVHLTGENLLTGRGA